jgi:hypothetical protein
MRVLGGLTGLFACESRYLTYCLFYEVIFAVSQRENAQLSGLIDDGSCLNGWCSYSRLLLIFD